MALQPMNKNLNPKAQPFFPEKPPQVSKGLDTEWNSKSVDAATNIRNPISTTGVATGKGKGRRKTRKTKKAKRKTRRRKH